MLVLGIPSGQRVEKLKAVIAAWRKYPVHILLLTWDCDTWDQCHRSVDDWILLPQRESFAKNHNRMMVKMDCLNWHGYICGADDLFPGSGIDKLDSQCQLHDGSLIWVHDGNNAAVMTHPVITRAYFNTHGPVFDERYAHNYCDTDLFMRAHQNIIKVNGIQFDHQWRTQGMDEIYQVGNDTFAEDKRKFIARFGEDKPFPQVQEVSC
jgi:hypothetical protein